MVRQPVRPRLASSPVAPPAWLTVLPTHPTTPRPLSCHSSTTTSTRPLCRTSPTSTLPRRRSTPSSSRPPCARTSNAGRKPCPRSRPSKCLGCRTSCTCITRWPRSSRRRRGQRERTRGSLGWARKCGRRSVRWTATRMCSGGWKVRLNVCFVCVDALERAC